MISEQNKLDLLNAQKIIIDQDHNCRLSVAVWHYDYLDDDCNESASIVNMNDIIRSTAGKINYEFSVNISFLTSTSTSNWYYLNFHIQKNTISAPSSSSSSSNIDLLMTNYMYLKNKDLINEYMAWLQSDECQEYINRLIKLKVFK